MGKWFLVALVVGMVVFSEVEAAGSLTVSFERLSLETARRITDTALVDCREKGIQIGVTVVDRDGISQVVLRDSIAPRIALEISRGKAYAAAMFGVPTSELGNRADTPIGRVPGLVMSAGGVPVQVGGTLLGAVGVSGAPSGEIDEACARAGVEAVRDDLELGDD